MKSSLKITPELKERADRLRRRELVRPLNSDGLFNGALYSVLSARENFAKHVGLHAKLIEMGLNTPRSIVRREDDVREVLKAARDPNKKGEHVVRLAEWWLDSDLPKRILADARNGKELEFNLRDELAMQAPGIGYKCSSFLMVKTGYQDVVVLDRWAARFLEDEGYGVRVQEERNSGYSRSEYLEAEGFMTDAALQRDLKPAELQRLVWVDKTGWGKWTLTPYDFRKAKELMKAEHVEPTDTDALFRSAMYCILSAAQDFEKQVEVYETLIARGLDSPEAVRNDRRKLSRALRGVRFPNSKEERIYNAAKWWQTSSIPGEILEDANNGKSRGYELRNALGDPNNGCHGIGLKCASLFMNKVGYKDVVPIDLWMIRFLNHLGHDIPVPDYKTQSGPKPKEYVALERELVEVAGEYEVSPALLQFAVWGKRDEFN